MKGYRWMREAAASFTIEATLVMGVILPVLLALIFAGFFVHDQAKLQGICSELAARGCCLVLEQDQNRMLAKHAETLSKNSMMWARGLSVQASAGEEQVSASAGATFPFPGFTGAFLSDGTTRCEASWSRTIYHPAKLIRKVRGVKALIDIKTKG